ncbi:MAG: LEA type 2 family protein [Bacteroidetes bacterium]|nr:LEA type 2 family protein [Bacteroidota bacterium]
MTRFIFLFMFFCSLLILSSCKDLQEIQVNGVESFHVEKISTEGIEAEVKLKIKNPNSVGFSIYPSDFEVSYSGIRLGKARLHKRVHINANTESTYVFKLKSNFEHINLMDITKLLNTANHGLIELNGDLKAGKFFVKKRIPVNYRQKVDMFK